MDWLKSRFIIVGIVVLGGFAMAMAQDRAEFAYLDMHASDGDILTLHSADRVTAGTVRLVGEGVEAEVELPAEALVGKPVPVIATVHKDGQEVLGQLMLEVQESGRFVSGTLHGEVGQWGINGGLRIRAAQVATLARSQLAVRQ